MKSIDLIKPVFWFMKHTYRILTSDFTDFIIMSVACLFATIGAFQLVSYSIPLFFIVAGLVYVFGLMATLPYTWNNIDDEADNLSVGAIFTGIIWGASLGYAIFVTLPA